MIFRQYPEKAAQIAKLGIWRGWVVIRQLRDITVGICIPAEIPGKYWQQTELLRTAPANGHRLLSGSSNEKSVSGEDKPPGRSCRSIRPVAGDKRSLQGKGVVYGHLVLYFLGLPMAYRGAGRLPLCRLTAVKYRFPVDVLTFRW
jgi:hypothetical protein